MPEMHECINRITELRQKQLSGGDLSDEELREGISLLAEVRAMRAGKAVGKSLEESAKDATKALTDFF